MQFAAVHGSLAASTWLKPSAVQQLRLESGVGETCLSARCHACLWYMAPRAIAICAHYSLTAVVQQVQKRLDKHPGVAKLLGRMSAKQAEIAIAKAWGNVPASPQLHHG